MDKTWIEVGARMSNAYLDGVELFLNFAYTNKSETSQIYCPCVKCANRVYKSRKDVNKHLQMFSILKTYKIWDHHGELYSVREPMVFDDNSIESDVRDDMCEMVREGLCHTPFSQSTRRSMAINMYIQLMQIQKNLKLFQTYKTLAEAFNYKPNLHNCNMDPILHVTNCLTTTKIIHR
ncbi:Transpos_assoc domain-containing protein [Cephalotus follicularis]|uniref:Transpos_assoc domain-containing protein n=1 Tax=Cephalotus follicularis TaxID=3775 RepID=A0A1Q3BBI9_CEPFO|nr:Transpos_assoc domain-containing protein [Cephalotus follicularis]